MKSPYRNWLELIENDNAPKLGFPKISAMIGVIRSAISALITAAKARAMTSPTAARPDPP